MTPAASYAAAKGLIEYFGCEAFADRYLLQLSGGERRLALLLSTFMSHLPVLVLDEPTNDLDPRRRHLVWRYLLQANREKGTTIVLVTHNVSEAETVVDRVMIMDRGKVLAEGAPGELKSRLGTKAKILVTLKPEVKPFGPLASARQVHGQTWEILVSEQEVIRTLTEILQAHEYDRPFLRHFLLAGRCLRGTHREGFGCLFQPKHIGF